MNDMNEEQDLAAVVWKAMRSLVTERYGRKAEVAAALDMSFTRARVLVSLIKKSITMTELAALLSTDAPYTTIMVNDLEERGLVERKASPQDRRVKIVAITDKGRKTAQLAERIFDTPPPFIRALQPDELAVLAQVLTAALSAEEQR